MSESPQTAPWSPPGLSPLEPVELLHARDHKYEGPRGAYKRCQTCGRRFGWIEHHGYPESLNVGGSGWNQHVFQSTKEMWERVWKDLLERTPLPRGLGRVIAEVQIGFPTLGSRDQDNFRFMLSKSLGDALQGGGWIPDDRFFPVLHYEMGSIHGVHTPREASTRIMLFPAWPESESAQASLL